MQSKFLIISTLCLIVFAQASFAEDRIAQRVEAAEGRFKKAVQLVAEKLDQARYLEVDAEQRRLVLAMPQPEVRRVAIDPNASRTLRCDRSGLWQLAVGSAHEDTVVTDALTIGHDRLVFAATRDDIVNRARIQTEAVLRRFVSELGWTIEVAWGE